MSRNSIKPGSDWIGAFAFDCLNWALGQDAPAFPPTVSYRDAKNPFTIDARLGEWQIGASGSHINIHIAGGLLKDADKGDFALTGVVLAARLTGRLEAVDVLNPGALSELQQVGLLDAVSTYLDDSRVGFAISDVNVESQAERRPPLAARLTGLLAVRETSVVVVIPGDVLLNRIGTPGLALLSALEAAPQIGFASLSGKPRSAGWPDRGTFHLKEAGLHWDALFLKGNWR